MADIHRHSRADRRKRDVRPVPLERRDQQTKPLIVRVESQDRTTIIHLDNIMVAENCHLARQAILENFNPHSTDKVILDLGGLSFMDSAALGLMVELKRRLAEEGVDLLITNPTRHIRWFITSLQMDRFLPII